MIYYFASDSVVFVRHCAVYKFTYLLTYLAVHRSLTTYNHMPTSIAFVSGAIYGSSFYDRTSAARADQMLSLRW